jgi:zinc transport system ATP-binding protein
MRPKMGYVPQALYFDRKFPISLLDLVLMGVLSKHHWLKGYPKHFREKAMTLLEELSLTQYAKAPISTLSGGQLQRGLIARALIADPSVLLLDEPTANIDSKSENILHTQLEKLSVSSTIFLVTHDLKTLRHSVDKVLYVHQTLSELAPEDVCFHYQMGVYHPPITKGEKHT